jgi:hypothetical protein
MSSPVVGVVQGPSASAKPCFVYFPEEGVCYQCVGTLPVGQELAGNPVCQQQSGTLSDGNPVGGRLWMEFGHDNSRVPVTPELLAELLSPVMPAFVVFLCCWLPLMLFCYFGLVCRALGNVSSAPCCFVMCLGASTPVPCPRCPRSTLLFVSAIMPSRAPRRMRRQRTTITRIRMPMWTTIGRSLALAVAFDAFE